MARTQRRRATPPPPGHPSIEEQLRRFGADAATQKRWRQARGQGQAETRDKDFRVFPCNWTAIQVWLRVCNQWRRAGMEGVRVALDHHCVWQVMEAMGYPHDLRLFDQVRILESGALAEFAERARK